MAGVPFAMVPLVVPTTSFNDSFYFPTRQSIPRPVWKSPLSPRPALPLCLSSLLSLLRFRSRLLCFYFPPLPRFEGRRSGNKGWLRPFSSARGVVLLSFFFLFSFFFFFFFSLFARRSSGTVYRGWRYVVRIIATVAISYEISKTASGPFRRRDTLFLPSDRLGNFVFILSAVCVWFVRDSEDFPTSGFGIVRELMLWGAICLFLLVWIWNRL